MTLDKLSQITEVGIKSGITLRNINVEGAYVSGVVTATTLNAENYVGNVTGNINPTTLNVTGVSTFNANIFLGDGDAAYFGDGQDLLIFHNSTDSIIRDNGTGDLYIEGGNRIKLTNPTGIETYGVFNQDGAVELYYDNEKKFETTSDGVSVSGTSGIGTALFVNGDARITGILTVGTSSITLDGSNNQVNVGVGVTIHHINGFQVGSNTLHSSGISLNTLNVGTGGNIITTTVGGLIGIGTSSPRISLDLGQKTDSIILPSGTTQQRPENPVNGMIRYNNSSSIIEGYIANSWRTISTGLTPLVQNGLVAALDASDVSSYPGSGTTIYDTSGTGSNGTINNAGVTWVSAGTSSYFNFPSQNDSYYIYQSSGSSQNYTSFTAALFIDSSSYSTFLYALATSNTSDLAFRINSGTIANPGNANDWAASATTYYYNGVAYTTNVTVSSGSWFIIGGAKNNGSIGSFSYNLGGGYTGRHWVGRMGAFYLYNRALTAEEQTQNFNALRSRFGL